MLIEELEKELLTYLKSKPIEIHGYVGTAYLGTDIANEFANGVINILKKAAGEPYKEGETEEYTFGEGGGYFLILRE
ncbi:MAG: hypothetical protein ACYDHZ_00855 [Dehalococcoidia bacterium]